MDSASTKTVKSGSSWASSSTHLLPKTKDTDSWKVIAMSQKAEDYDRLE